ncbi:hypothetical protein QRQ56_25445 [Bradyrhizobium sp. U531]|uniref:hypothetical protein n=1 Tax=Bradyrhizobium sp. U531 TaxID=3053458 RepID=UPI003F432EA1
MAPANDIVARIFLGDRFKSDLLGDVLLSMQGRTFQIVERATFARARALIGLNLAETAKKRKGPGEVDGNLAAAGKELVSALSSCPIDSLLWLLQYSFALDRNGLDAGAFSFLDQSYRAGPSEGWVALRRERISLAAFTAVPRELQTRIVAEFAAMIESGFIDDAAYNLTTIGWPHRERLLAGIAGVDIIAREAFARRLAREGLSVEVPGVAVDERRW